jgi:hypothetical protein
MLFETIETLSQEPWEWGAMDCCQFARRVLIETHGIDFAKDQPEYDNAFAAAKIIARAGGMESFVSSMLGDPVPRNLIRRGDVCIADFPAGLATGICVGQSAAFASESGVVYIPMKQVIKGWNV